MRWYDYFANFYDASLEKIYFSSRKRAVELLDLREGQTVLDVACGTGANFSHILNFESDLNLYGTDFSSGMLRRCQQKVDKAGWEQVKLFQADARELSGQLLEQQFKKTIQFDRIICALGLSVLPDWETVMLRMLDLLRPGGMLVVMDVYAEKRDFNSWLVEKIAKADLNRKIGVYMEENTTAFQLEYMPVKESKVGGKLFVAKGEKIR